MRLLLRTLAVLLLIGWGLSVFVFALTELLHILLVLAIVAYFLSRRKKKQLDNPYHPDKSR